MRVISVFPRFEALSFHSSIIEHSGLLGYGSMLHVSLEVREPLCSFTSQETGILSSSLSFIVS